MLILLRICKHFFYCSPVVRGQIEKLRSPDFSPQLPKSYNFALQLA
ncbi:hypothetical protein [Nostoc sp.]